MEAVMTVAAPVQDAPAEGGRHHDKYDRLVAAAQSLPKLKVAVAHPCDAASMGAVFEAAALGLIDPILVGPPKSGSSFKEIPHVPNWDTERAEAVEYEGLPPLGPKKTVKGKVVLKNVREVWIRNEEGVKERWFAEPGQRSGTVVLVNGAIACVGAEGWCLTEEIGGGNKDPEQLEVDLEGGAVGPGLMTFGSPLGIEEIAGERGWVGGGDAHRRALPGPPRLRQCVCREGCYPLYAGALSGSGP